ncbi:MAG TPA: hypothetical protein VFD49_17035 [Candidatus Dormibacteraeota bacterium]|nr:hypothetical protein [Candidatus Dormibacteraeota bacterium]
MFTKMAFFGLGYLLGSRAGRQRYEEIVGAVRDFLQGEEVATAVGFVRGMLWILRQRGRGLDRTQP